MEHKGIAITFNEHSGKFTAVRADGTKIQAASVQGVRNKIDGLDKFTSFTGLTREYYASKLKSVTVIGVKASRQRHGRNEWKLADGGTASYVYLDSEKNLAALANLDAVRERHNAEAIELRARQETERAAAEALVEKREP